MISDLSDLSHFFFMNGTIWTSRVIIDSKCRTKEIVKVTDLTIIFTLLRTIAAIQPKTNPFFSLKEKENLSFKPKTCSMNFKVGATTSNMRRPKMQCSIKIRWTRWLRKTCICQNYLQIFLSKTRLSRRREIYWRHCSMRWGSRIMLSVRRSASSR